MIDDRLASVVEAQGLVHRLAVGACWGPAPVWRILHHMEERFDLEIEGLLRAPVVEEQCARCQGRTDRPGFLCGECRRIVGHAPFTQPERASQEPGAMLLPCGHREDEHPDPGCDGLPPVTMTRADAEAWADAGVRELERALELIRVEVFRLPHQGRGLADLDSRISGLHFEDEGR